MMILKRSRIVQAAVALVIIVSLALIVNGVVNLINSPEGWERGWLVGKPCFAPCWEGITPGETTKLDAERYVRNLPQIDQLQQNTDGSFGNAAIYWTRWKNSDYGSGSISFLRSTNLVVRIQIGFPHRFGLGTVIKAYGDPSHVIALTSNNVEQPKQIGYIFEMFWQSHGIMIPWASGIGGTRPSISSNLELDTVDFFQPTPSGFEQFMLEWNPSQAKLLIPWKGYIAYQQYCDLENTITADACDTKN